MFKRLGRNNQLVMLALFVWALGEGLWYINFRQLYLVELGATEAQVGLVLAIESIVRACLPIPAGYLADRIGSQRVMVASWFIGTIGPLVCVLAPSWQWAVPGLLIYSLSGFSVPAISAYVLQNASNHNTPDTSDGVLGLVYAVYPAGLILSPSLGGIIADRFGLRACFWISLVIFIASTSIVIQTRPVEDQQPQTAQKPENLFRNKAFNLSMIYFAVVFLGVFVGMQLLPNYLQETRQFTYSRIGMLYSFASLGMVLINLLVSRVNPRWNFALILVFYCLAVFGIWKTANPVFLILSFAALGSNAVVRTIATARMADITDPSNHALAFGVIETIMSIALAVSSAIAGALFVKTPGHDLPLIAALASVSILAVGWLIIRRWMLPEAGSLDVQAAAAGSR
ncbi:MAG: MFS transporter [Anaerolineae bacterium]|nr:MFS transporter [Anaerolineae bacterium]